MRAHLGTEGLLPKVCAREQQHGLESVEVARDGWHGERLSGNEGRAHLMREAIIGHEGRAHEASLVMREAIIGNEGSTHEASLLFRQRPTVHAPLCLAPKGSVA